MAETLPFTLLPPEESKVGLLATPEPRFCNLTNTVHGGWIMTMLDTVMALAAQTTLSAAGGGNTAVQEALYLSNLASKVTVVPRRDRFRAGPILQDRLPAKPNVEVLWNHVIDEVIGEQEPRKSVTGIRIREVNTDDVKELTTHGLFVAIGHDPATALFRGQLDMDDAGYIKVGSWSTKTTVPGGAGCRRCHRLGIPSGNHRCRHGKHCGLEAEKFLAEHSPGPAVGRSCRMKRRWLERKCGESPDHAPAPLRKRGPAHP